jgi:predicted porin
MKLVSRIMRAGWHCAAALFVIVWAMPAAAADLGGDCCADLEERVAELEATTARKGNRKVSLTVSGWVNENIMWWDDGLESNTYVGTNPVYQSRLRFVGEARITPDVSAGYVLEFGIYGANPTKWNQDNADGTSNNLVSVRKSNWFLKSRTYGKVSVGQESTATYHLLDDADTTLTRNFYQGEAAADYVRPFFVVTAAGDRLNLKWSDVLRGFTNSTPGDSGRRNVVRYQTPTFGGFSVAASWGEDDVWDMALVYAGKLGDFKVNGRAGYGNSTDGASTQCHGETTPENGNCEWWGVSGLVQHVPTGLYVFAGYGDQNDNSRVATVADPALRGLVDADDRTWFVQGGVEKKWFALGKTNFFGEYRSDDAGSNVNGSGTLVTQSANVNYWAIGGAQEFSAASAMLYLVYQHVDGDVTLGTDTSATDLQSMQQVIGGMKITF